MKATIHFIALIACSFNFILPNPSLEGWGYQPDMEGYAYTESTRTIANAPLAPLAALGVAVAIGALLYTNQHHHKSKNKNCHHHH